MIVGQAAFDALCDGRRAVVQLDVGESLPGNIGWLEMGYGLLLRAQPAPGKKGIECTVVAWVKPTATTGWELTLQAGDQRDVPRILTKSCDGGYTRPSVDDRIRDLPPAVMDNDPGESVHETHLDRVAAVATTAREKKRRAEESVRTIEAELERLDELGVLGGGQTHALRKKLTKAKQVIANYEQGGEAA